MMQVNMEFGGTEFKKYCDDAIPEISNERLLDGDHVVRTLDPKGVEEFVEFFYKNDRWYDFTINECYVVPEEKEREETEMNFCNENSNRVIPVRFTAVPSILQRAGLNCPLMQRTSETKTLGVLTPEEKTTWISKGLSLNKASAKILIREGKVSAMLSSGYGIMPVKSLLDATIKSLRDEHPDATVISGQVSHDFFLIDIDLGDSIGVDGLICEISKMFPDVKNKKAKVVADLQTSDVGLSCATIRLNLLLGEDFVFPIGKSLKLKHANSNTFAKFNDELKKVGSVLQEAEDMIEKMGNMPIKHVIGCVKRIQMEKSWIPKKTLDELSSGFKRRYPTSGTAIDVYLLICEIIDKVKKGTKDLNTFVTLSEELSKLMYLDYEKYDYPDME